MFNEQVCKFNKKMLLLLYLPCLNALLTKTAIFAPR